VGLLPGPGLLRRHRRLHRGKHGPFDYGTGHVAVVVWVDDSNSFTERFSSCDLAGLKDVDGLGELPGARPATCHAD
jgi:hypothetical protein